MDSQGPTSMYPRNQLHRWFGVAALVVALVTLVPPSAASAVDFQAGLSDPSALKVHEGTIEVTEDGTVIENLELRGTLRIEASDVTVRNVWVYTTAEWTVYVASGSATFENVEIGNPSVVGERGIGGSNIVASGLNIHSVEDGIKIGSNAHYTNVWVHDLDSQADDAHFDAAQADGGAMGSSITNSVLSSLGRQGIGNAAIFLKSDRGPIADITISNSYLEGGNYMNSVRDGGSGLPTNVVFTDNRVGDTFRYGVTRFDASVEWSGNVWDTSGVPVNPGDKVPPPATTTTTSTTTTTAPSTTTTGDPTTTTTAAPIEDTTSLAPSTTAAALVQADDDTETNSGVSAAVVVGAAAILLIALLLAAVAGRWVGRRSGGQPPGGLDS